MADGIIPSVADALLKEIQGHDFGLQFDSERSYGQWNDKLEELDKLRVDVVIVTVPMREDVAQATQEDLEFQPSFDVVIRKAFGEQSDRDSVHNRLKNDVIDPLVKLAEDILLFLTDLPLGDYSEASWESSRLRVLAWRKHLVEYGQFTSVVRVTYSIVKDLP